MDDAIRVSQVGLQATTGAASAVAAIPTMQNTGAPKYVRLQALANCYVKPGFAGTTCTVNDILLSPNESLILYVAGFTHIAHLQETPAAKFNITPLENF